MSKKYIIYKTTNLINNKIYIGFHTILNDEFDDGYLGSGKLILRAIKKYGKENFKREILKIFENKKEAESYEKFLVNDEFVNREDTYNLSIGGNVTILNGKHNGFYGKTHSHETIEKIQKNRSKTIEERGYTVLSKYHCSIDNIEFFNLKEIRYYLQKIKGEFISIKNIILIVTDETTNNEFFDKDFDFQCRKLRIKILNHIEKMSLIRSKQASERFKNVPKTEEHRNNISKSHMGKKCPWNLKVNIDPEKIRKTREKHLGMKRSKKARQNMSEALKRLYADVTLQNPLKNKLAYTDPETNKVSYFKEGEAPDNFIKGNKTNIHKRSYYNKETFIVKKFDPHSVPEGWIKGGVNRANKAKKLKKEKNQTFLHNDDQYEILTPDGWSNFEGLLISHEKEIISLTDFDLKCTPNHQIQLTNESEFVDADTLHHERIDGTHDVYDIFKVKKKNRYYTNGIISHNCTLLYWDEGAWTPNDIDFFESIYPTISSGQTTKFIITSTPNGKRGVFYRLWIDDKNAFSKILATWRDNPTRTQKWYEETLANLGEDQFAQEYECEFRGTANSLISSKASNNLEWMNPIEKHDNGLKIFKYPIKDHVYFTTVDVSRGIGGDNHAISVIDITNKNNYEVVATYRNSTLPTLLYPTLIHNVAKKYNESYVLIEINDIGEQVANNLYYDFEYDGVIHVRVTKDRQIMGFSNDSRPGIRTSTKVKSIGCSNLKTLIENNKMTLNDENILDELANFVPSRGSYAAASGSTDDQVMTLVLFAWATTQQYFIDLTGINIRNQLLDNNTQYELEALINNPMNDVVPFGIIDDGQDEYSGLGHNSASELLRDGFFD